MDDATTTARPTGPDKPLDGRALIEALKAGGPQAPRVLIERFQGVLFGLCLRMMGHRHDAEDVLQDALLHALRGIDRSDNTRPFRPWLLRIAANRSGSASTDGCAVLGVRGLSGVDGSGRARNRASAALDGSIADPLGGCRAGGGRLDGSGRIPEQRSAGPTTAASRPCLPSAG